MSRTGTIVVFAKPPVAGQAKTRLIPAVGPKGSVAVAKALFADTWSMLSAVDARRIAGSTSRHKKALGLRQSDALWLQGDGDLGERMERILRRCCDAGPWGIIVGADSPDLSAEVVTEATRALEHTDAVLVPSDDGGYALIGLRTVPRGLLHDLPWSTDHTFDATMRRFLEHGLSVRVLDSTFDVDTPGDLARLRRWLAEHPTVAPNTRQALTELGMLEPVGLSVVIPVLNEAQRIGKTLDSLLTLPGIDEVVVVDGGSTDNTADIVQRYPTVRRVQSQRGRGPQLNAGAAAAHGETLLFLHADCQLPYDAANCIREALADPGVAGGAFKLWTVPDSGPRLGAWWIHIADIRSRYTRFPYGDQAVFCRRIAFEAVGGFPDQPILEDLGLSQRLWDQGRLVRINRRVIASARRFEHRPLYYGLLMNTFPWLAKAGMPVERLAALYKDVR